MGVTHAASASDDSADPYANRKAVDTKINLNPNASRKVSRLMDASAKGTKNFSPVFGLSATPETTLYEAIVQMQKSSKYGKKLANLAFSVRAAKLFAENFRMEHQNSKSKINLDKLSDDRIAAINFFTHETPFYGCLN